MKKESIKGREEIIIKIADFGISKIIGKINDLNGTPNTGSIRYKSP